MNEVIKHYEELIIKYDKEVMKLNNIINKLEEELEKAIEFLEHFDSGQQCEHTKDLAIIVENILQGDDKGE